MSEAMREYVKANNVKEKLSWTTLDTNLSHKLDMIMSAVIIISVTICQSLAVIFSKIGN